MADLRGENLNQLFDTLAEWNAVLEHTSPDLSPFP